MVANAQPGSADSPAGEEPISYNRQIRPILANSCLTCHCPDAGSREAELRLDTFEGATAPREGGPAIVPGDPEASELIRRVRSDAPDLAMPPATVQTHDHEEALGVSPPVTVCAWCTLCLLAALIMLPTIPLEVDEVVAWVSTWSTANGGGLAVDDLLERPASEVHTQPDQRTPELAEFPDRPGLVMVASIWGTSYPWTLIATSLVGLGLMFVPLLLAIDRPASNVYHVGGALIITVSICAMGETIRLFRYANLLIALCLIMLPWLIGDHPWSGIGIALIAALLVGGLSIPSGPQIERYGTWDRWVRRRQSHPPQSIPSCPCRSHGVRPTDHEPERRFAAPLPSGCNRPRIRSLAPEKDKPCAIWPQGVVKSG